LGRKSPKRVEKEREKIEDRSEINGSSSSNRIEYCLSVGCGSKPVLLVDAVEIFLRLWELSENQNGARLFQG
jgi:hypothetical protein